MICRLYDVVVVPFPFTDRRATKRRPAVALSGENFNAASGNSVLAMVTSATHSSWPLDIPIDAKGAGLRAPSIVRMKIFTLNNRLILRRAGNLQESDRRAVAQALMDLSDE